MQALNVERVRKHFPAFGSSSAGSDTSQPDASWSFFENAGGTLPVSYVIDRLHDFYLNYKVQPYGHSPMQSRAGDAMDEGRSRMAAMLGLRKEQMIIGPSTTQNFNTLSNAFTGVLQAGDEVVISEQDHEANIGGWLRACKLSGAVPVFWQVDPNSGELELSELDKCLNQRTRLVCVTHSSNIIGSINPLESIAEILQNHSSKKIYLVADGVSYAPHGLPDINHLANKGIDAYSFSTYKTFGPHLGIMYVREELSDQLTPQCHYFNEGKYQLRFDSAGPDHASIAALAGIADYFEKLYAEHDGDVSADLATQVRACSKQIKRYEQALCSPVFEVLGHNNARIYGRASNDDEREANIAFSVPGQSSTELNRKLASFGIAAGNGDFYAPRVLKRMGCEDTNDGVVRLSFAHYNDQIDVDKLVHALESALN